VAFSALLLATAGLAASAEAPQPLCRGGENDDVARPIPESLIPAAVRLFGLDAMTPEQVRRSTVCRCAAGRALVCNLGANLPCGKADRRSDLLAADAWCAKQPGSNFIPMYVTGHETIYRWRCNGTKAATIGAPLETDRQGFISRYWKAVGGATQPRR
jgi:hypothetical protein